MIPLFTNIMMQIIKLLTFCGGGDRDRGGQCDQRSRLLRWDGPKKR